MHYCNNIHMCGTQNWIYFFYKMYFKQESPPAWMQEGVPTLDGGYLPWMGVPTLGYPLPHPDLASGGGGTYRGQRRGWGEGYLPWMGEGYLPWSTPPLSWLGQGVTYIGQGEGYLPWCTPHSDLAWGVPTLEYPLPHVNRHLWKHNLPSYNVRGR